MLNGGINKEVFLYLPYPLFSRVHLLFQPRSEKLSVLQLPQHYIIQINTLTTRVFSQFSNSRNRKRILFKMRYTEYACLLFKWGKNPKLKFSNAQYSRIAYQLTEHHPSEIPLFLHHFTCHSSNLPHLVFWQGWGTYLPSHVYSCGLFYKCI